MFNIFGLTVLTRSDKKSLGVTLIKVRDYDDHLHRVNAYDVKRHKCEEQLLICSFGTQWSPMRGDLIKWSKLLVPKYVFLEDSSMTDSKLGMEKD